MPKHKKFKTAVRERMQKTGEKYAAARANLAGETYESPPVDPIVFADTVVVRTNDGERHEFDGIESCVEVPQDMNTSEPFEIETRIYYDGDRFELRYRSMLGESRTQREGRWIIGGFKTGSKVIVAVQAERAVRWRVAEVVERREEPQPAEPERSPAQRAEDHLWEDYPFHREDD